jgi:hypothetical protein
MPVTIDLISPPAFAKYHLISGPSGWSGPKFRPKIRGTPWLQGPIKGGYMAISKSTGRPTNIKALRGASVICQFQSCEKPARFLFRSGRGRILHTATITPTTRRGVCASGSTKTNHAGLRVKQHKWVLNHLAS